MPQKDEIIHVIESHIKTINYNTTTVELAFFGGNFTGIACDLQENLLSIVKPYIKRCFVHSIRISTRPDYINSNILELLKNNAVKTIELGVQSLDDEVLKLSGRGYTRKDVDDACNLIKAYGFELGLQMMIGLPGDTLERAVNTAHTIVEWGAAMTRIYPLLVIKGTPLEQMFVDGLYKPLVLTEAVEWCKELYKIFNNGAVKVLKMGLHPSKELLNNGTITAGPFHLSFAELVFTSLWNEKFSELMPDKDKSIIVYVSPLDYNHAIGYEAKNKKQLSAFFKSIKFVTDVSLNRFQYHVDYS